MFKVGDEVWVRGKIAEVDTEDTCDRPYLVKTSFGTYTWVLGKESEVTDKTYTQGLADAWELAKKLESMSLEELEKAFGVCGFYSVVKQYKIEEALAKISEYEKEKEIKVGDVVNIFHNGSNGVVVRVNATDGLNIVLENGLFYADCCRGDCVKTGRHIDIESLLRQIGE